MICQVAVLPWEAEHHLPRTLEAGLGDSRRCDRFRDSPPSVDVLTRKQGPGEIRRHRFRTKKSVERSGASMSIACLVSGAPVLKNRGAFRHVIPVLRRRIHAVLFGVGHLC